MAYGSYLSLAQSRVYNGDYSSDAFLTGTIYTDSILSTAKDITNYTLKVRMNKPGSSGDSFNKTATIVTGTSGTWKYLVASGELPPAGLYYVKIELSKAGVLESTLNRVELLILRGPSA